ncbi:MAG: hypothetical protein HC923_10140 [Myxococcales bacterium]|nr:hypothetical protein [Myxococcales bacterium]
MSAMSRALPSAAMHNATFDLKMLWATYGESSGVREASVADTQLLEQMLRNGRRTDVVMQGFGLKALAERYAGMELDKTIRQGFYGIRSLSELSATELYYAARDVEATWKVFAQQLPEVARDGLTRAAGVECAAANAFAELELKGFAIDREAWSQRIAQSKADLSEAKKALDYEFRTVADRDLFGATTLNYDDDQEVLSALKRLGVEVPSVQRRSLLGSGHPASLAVASYREHRKWVSTYGEGFLAHVHEVTGRVHARFKSIGASTGRTACSEPNLQNIPSESDFRGSFVAPPGRKLLTADYAGAELRILAEMSKDPVFLEAFGRGEDLHAKVAKRLFQREVSKTDNPELRERAKAINFGLAYGMSAAGLAAELDISERDARELLEAHFRAFPKIRSFLDEASQQALRRGFAETLTGRRMWFTDMRREGKDEASLVRIAKNMPIQGTNADMTKLAMSRFSREAARRGLDAFLVNMVHDELVVECDESQAEVVTEVLKRSMISAGAELLRSVPVEVDVSIGSSWC